MLNEASDFVADKLSADIDPGVALEEVKISEPASLPADREKVTGPGKSDEGVLSFLAGTEKSGEQIARTRTEISTTNRTKRTIGNIRTTARTRTEISTTNRTKRTI